MSESLERVIAEQQAEIDNLKADRAACDKLALAAADRLEELCRRVLHLIEFKPQSCWREDKKDELTRYRDLTFAVHHGLMDVGWCFHCGYLFCSGDCHDD